MFLKEICGYDGMADIGHLKCPEVTRGGSSPPTRTIGCFYII